MRIKLDVKSMPTERTLRAALEKKFKEAGERRAARASRIRCPEHHKAATIRTSLQADGYIHYDVSTCCDALRKLVITDLGKA